MDSFEAFKAVQKQGWANFAPLELVTMGPAARLVAFAGVAASQNVLDVACGTGVVAITARRAGARVTALDLTPELLERARYNSQIAGLEVAWREGDIEALPFEDGSFDAVLSQFGHIFAPRPLLALSEMLRVLKPEGTIAFTTWPPELLVGRVSTIAARYMPQPPPGVAPPAQWGDRATIQERFANSARDIVFATGITLVPALSPQHFRMATEKAAGPLVKLVETLTAGDPSKLECFRREYDAVVAEYFHDNAVEQGYLMTRAIKN